MHVDFCRARSSRPEWVGVVVIGRSAARRVGHAPLRRLPFVSERAFRAFMAARLRRQPFLPLPIEGAVCDR